MPKKLRIAVRKFPPFESAIRKQWDIFEASRCSGFSLEIVPLDMLPLHNALFERDGLKDGTFDLTFLGTDRVLYASTRGDLVDLVPYIERSPPIDFPAGWSDSMLRLQRVNGCILGMPYHDGPECLIFRKDLFGDEAEKRAFFREFGTALAPPKTWDEFSRIAQYFHRPEQGLYGCAFAAFPDGHNTVFDFLLQLWTRGGELTGPDGVIRLFCEQAIDGLTFYRAMVVGGEAVHPDCRTLDSVRSGEAFARGEVAMMVNWFGFAAVAQASSASKVNGNVDIAYVPSKTGCSSVSFSMYWLLCIATGTPHKDLCYEFLRHCASPEMDKLLTLEGAIGCRKSTWSDPEVNSSIPFYRQMESLHQIARELPQIPEWPLINEVLDDLVQATINTDRPIEDLLRESDRRIAVAGPLPQGQSS